MKKYQPKEIENKWQKKWKEEKLYSPDIDKSQNPYYALMMFPYPSAEGLHVGNMYPFTGTDIFARFKRMQGFDVLEPIGLDGFGIHSENYALKVNQHPMDLSKITEKRFYEQLTEIGDAYDWTRTVETYKPEYYKWTQWLFLQMYKKGLAYKKAAEVNWCPSCKTVLADEQVIAGVCERCGSKVEKKNLEQWFFKITDYADRLLDNLDWIDWTDKVKIAQRNWIGKKTGINISYKIEESNEEVTVFTTRPDTNFGTTFIVLAPEHQLVKKITKKENLEE
ncbi:MAG: Leucine-tRNA ligase, partial [Candidatus Daviesbacteria bacterium GW2011_GWA1_36_8]